MSTSIPVWQLDEITSPNLQSPVPIISARNVPYITNAHRFQTINIYLRKDATTEPLIHQPVTTIPTSPSGPLTTHVHIHGGAWRDPTLTATSAEPFAAHAFTAPGPLRTIISINYTLSPFPTHPTNPYDPAATPGADPAREATHPAHVADILHAFARLRALGLADGRFLLSGHSAGACLAFQTTLAAPAHFGLDVLAAPPRPAALVGLNGLYDLVALVHGLGPTHAALSSVYQGFQEITFGREQEGWVAASPARFARGDVERGVREGRSPRVVYVDQSVEDQLVPVNQAERMQALLKTVEGVEVVRGYRLTGLHAAPWEQGYLIWEVVSDVLKVLGEST